ncbi:FlgD immunoglobulin-like domain containing protein [bacterium]
MKINSIFKIFISLISLCCFFYSSPNNSPAEDTITLTKVLVTESFSSWGDMVANVYLTIPDTPAGADSINMFFITDAKWAQSSAQIKDTDDEYVFLGYIWKGHKEYIGTDTDDAKNSEITVTVEFVDTSDPNPQNHVQIGLSRSESFTLDEVTLSWQKKAAEELKDAYCYPCPARLTTDGGDTIKFANLTANAEINILSPAGYIVKSLTADSSGSVLPSWDGKDDNGEMVGSGTYIVHIHDNKGNKKVFNILIIQ